MQLASKGSPTFDANKRIGVAIDRSCCKWLCRTIDERKNPLAHPLNLLRHPSVLLRREGSAYKSSVANTDVASKFGEGIGQVPEKGENVLVSWWFKYCLSLLDRLPSWHGTRSHTEE